MAANATVEPAPERGAAPERVPAFDAGGRAAADPRSDLYKVPVAFQGRSLEGAPPRDDPQELARSLDAEMPVDDLFPIQSGPDEPDMKFMVICDPGIDGRGAEVALVERRAAYAERVRTIPVRRRDPVRGAAGGRTAARARNAADDRWAAFVSANRTSPLSFGGDPSRILSLVESGTTSYPDEGAEAADSYPGANLGNALDHTRAARCIPEARGRRPDHGTGFGQVANGWNEFPFSYRERILNALSAGESLGPDWIAVLDRGIEGSRAARGTLFSTRYPAMLNMVPDAGGGCRHLRGHVHGTRGRRLLQLVEMLDHAEAVV